MSLALASLLLCSHFVSPQKHLPRLILLFSFEPLPRVMDSNEGEHAGSTGTPDGIDLIEAVAQANDISESGPALPRLQ